MFQIRSFFPPQTIYFLWGLLLSVAFISKFILVVTDPFADIKLDLPTNVSIAVLLLEFPLAFSNFRYKPNRALWLTNLTCASVFLVALVYRWTTGYESCGCFGHVALPPWLMLIVDSSFVVAFLFARPPKAKKSVVASPVVKGRTCALAGVLIFMCLFHLPIFDGLRNKLSADSAIVGTIVLPTHLTAGSTLQTEVQLSNLSEHPATVNNSIESCTCVSVDKKARRILPHSTTTIPIHLEFDAAGSFHQRIVFFLDHPRQDWVIVNILGLVRKDQK